MGVVAKASKSHPNYVQAEPCHCKAASKLGPVFGSFMLQVLQVSCGHASCLNEWHASGCLVTKQGVHQGTPRLVGSLEGTEGRG